MLARGFVGVHLHRFDKVELFRPHHRLYEGIIVGTALEVGLLDGLSCCPCSRLHTDLGPNEKLGVEVRFKVSAPVSSFLCVLFTRQRRS